MKEDRRDDADTHSLPSPQFNPHLFFPYEFLLTPWSFFNAFFIQSGDDNSMDLTHGGRTIDDIDKFDNPNSDNDEVSDDKNENECFFVNLNLKMFLYIRKSLYEALQCGDKT